MYKSQQCLVTAESGWNVNFSICMYHSKDFPAVITNYKNLYKRQKKEDRKEICKEIMFLL